MMITTNLDFCVRDKVVRSDGRNYKDKLSNFCEVTLRWGTSGSYWETLGTYDPGDGLRPMPELILNKENYHYRDHNFGGAQLVLEKHIGDRQGVWAMRAASYGAVTAGLTVGLRHLTGPLGVFIEAKINMLSAATGFTAAGSGYLYHAKRSCRPYEDQMDFLLRLDDLIGLINEGRSQPWMEDNKAISRIRGIAPAAFDHALVELRQAGLTLGKTFDRNQAYKIQEQAEARARELKRLHPTPEVSEEERQRRLMSLNAAMRRMGRDAEFDDARRSAMPKNEYYEIGGRV